MNKVDERPSDWPIGCGSGGVSNCRPIYLPPHPVMWYVTSTPRTNYQLSFHREQRVYVPTYLTVTGFNMISFRFSPSPSSSSFSLVSRCLQILPFHIFRESLLCHFCRTFSNASLKRNFHFQRQLFASICNVLHVAYVAFKVSYVCYYFFKLSNIGN